MTGKYNQLAEAASRSDQGDRVSIEGRKQTLGDPESGQADIVDHTTQEAMQMKVVTSASVDGVVRNVNSAVNQLGGSGGEDPPIGYKRIAEIRLHTAENPLSRATKAEIIAALRGQIPNLGNLTPPGAPVGEIRVTNERGTFIITPAELQ